MTLVLKMSSIFFLVPFTVTNIRHGLRTLRVAPKYHVFLTAVGNVAGGLRLAFFIYSSVQANFKWYIKGQFTADATFFAIWFLLALVGYVGHFGLIYR